MRASYDKHYRLAISQGMEDPILVALYGAMCTRYQLCGKFVSEQHHMAEVWPFRMMEQQEGKEHLANYVLAQEIPGQIDLRQTRAAINRVLRERYGSNADERYEPFVGLLGLLLLEDAEIEWWELLDTDVASQLEADAERELKQGTEYASNAGGVRGDADGVRSSDTERQDIPAQRNGRSAVTAPSIGNEREYIVWFAKTSEEFALLRSWISGDLDKFANTIANLCSKRLTKFDTADKLFEALLEISTDYNQMFIPMLNQRGGLDNLLAIPHEIINATIQMLAQIIIFREILLTKYNHTCARELFNVIDAAEQR